MGSISSRLHRSSHDDPPTPQTSRWRTKRFKCLPIVSRRSRLRQIFTCTKEEKSSSESVPETERQTYEHQREHAMKNRDPLHLSNELNSTPTPIDTPSASPVSQELENDSVPPVLRQPSNHSRYRKPYRHTKSSRKISSSKKPKGSKGYEGDEDKVTAHPAMSLPIPEADKITKGKRYRNRVQRYSMKSVKSSTPSIQRDVMSALSLSGTDEHIGDTHVSIAEPLSHEHSLEDGDDILSNDEDKSSTEREDEISIVYATPTIASAHVVRPIPSPSSLSEPQLSVGSGLASQETSQTIFPHTRHSLHSLSLFPPLRSPSITSDLSNMVAPPSQIYSPEAVSSATNNSSNNTNAALMSKPLASIFAKGNLTEPVSAHTKYVSESHHHSISFHSAGCSTEYNTEYRTPNLALAENEEYSLSDHDSPQIDIHDLQLQLSPSVGAPINESNNGSKTTEGRGKMAAIADRIESIPQK
jgi:hypothetical protein